MCVFRLLRDQDDVVRPPPPDDQAAIMPSIPDEFLQKLGLKADTR